MKKVLSVVLILTAFLMSAGVAYSTAQGAVQNIPFDAGCLDEAHEDGDFAPETETGALTPQPGPQMLDPSRVFPLPAGSGYAYEDGFGDDRDFGGGCLHTGQTIHADAPIDSIPVFKRK